jgi:hypothetical protein
VAQDPTNADWQRDLSVSHYKLAGLAREEGDLALVREHYRSCYTVLKGMKQRGLHMDPAMAQLHEWLAGRFFGR